MIDRFKYLKDWVGKKEVRNDTINTWPIAALAATLDEQVPCAENGQSIPPGWHWLFFLEAKRASELGIDGHPPKGGFLPPVPLPRRMWAGGRLEFIRPLEVGQAVTRESTIVSVEPKSGRSGDLVFVTVRHTVQSAGAIATVEEQDIVYRDAAKKGDPLTPSRQAPDESEWTRRVVPDTVLLFRYSALTFNGHRIHYDMNYAVNEEHYPGLVVHGPLQAILLLSLCRQRSVRPVKKFEYRALHPLFGSNAFTVNGDYDSSALKAELWTADEAKAYAMRATAYF
jgi:3-methylfumaryl-CoA hydratase